MTHLEELKNFIKSVIPENDIELLEIIPNDAPSVRRGSLVIRTKYEEELYFYDTGKVKCYNEVINKCFIGKSWEKEGHYRFIWDALTKSSVNFKTDNDNKILLSYLIIREWNVKEKSGYWSIDKYEKDAPKDE